MLRDLSFAVRQLRKSPGFALAAVLTLALGICATSTILSWISSTLLNPIPGVSNTSRMVTIERGERNEHPSPPLSYPDFVDMRAQAKSFSGMLGYHDDFMSITGNGQPERIYGALASADYFEVLGVMPLLGRTLIDSRQNERAGVAEAVLSYGLWQRHFGGDPAIIGKTIQINLHPFTIVGVAPPEFIGCKSGLRTDIWLPLGVDRGVWGGRRIDHRESGWLNVLGVQRPGVSARTAQNELNTIMQGIVRQYPADHLGNNAISIDPLWRSPFGANVYWAGTLPILLALAAVLLLLACANVANLLLVRSVSRRREFAVRLSLGAGRWALARQLLIENAALALAAGGLALLATTWTSTTVRAFLPSTTLPLAMRGGMDQRVLIVTILLSLATAVLSGILPAWRVSHLAPATALKDEALAASGGIHKSRIASLFVIAQVALSMLLLACAGLFVRSLEKAQAVNPGFDSSGVLVATLDLSPMGYSREQGIEFQRQLVARVEQLPGVVSATLADFSPLSFTIHSDDVMPQGYVPRLHESMEVDRGSVGPGYLRVLRTPLLAGRDFTAADNTTAHPVAIVNRAFAERYWPGQNAIGKQIQVSGAWRTVVGIAGNGKYRRLTKDPAPLVLMPLEQRYQSEVILHVRTAGDPLRLEHAVERTFHSLNANLPLFNVSTLKQSMQLGSIFERVAVAFAGTFGLLALVLAAVGIYGVIAYTAKQRTREIGIRMALGASKWAILHQVLMQGMKLAVAGMICGAVVSLILTRFVRGMLYGIGSTDWITFSMVALLLCIVALVACLIPAGRAAAVDPMQALRTE
ncbi:MAG: ABC transporter permease [Acidobacteriota bacterium]